MPFDQVRKAREHDRARDAFRQRAAEGGADVRHVRRLAAALLRRQPDARAIAVATRHAVDGDLGLTLEQIHERPARLGDTLERGRSEHDGLAGPGDAPDRLKRQVRAMREPHGHAATMVDHVLLAIVLPAPRCWRLACPSSRFEEQAVHFPQKAEVVNAHRGCSPRDRPLAGSLSMGGQGLEPRTPCV